MRRTRRMLMAPAVALLVLVLWAPSASASQQPREWREGDTTGDCAGGWTRGGYVFSVQSILWASGLLSASGVDGIWGPVTESASRTWQSRHGLTADGCWGFNTWNKAQHGYHNVRIGGEVIRFNHMTLTSQSNPNDVRWRYEERNLNNGRRVAYSFAFGICWYVDPPGTRSWTLVSHPGDTSCG